MNCNEVQNLLNEYIDGELPQEQRQQIELHLKDCSNCQKELNALRSLLAKTAALPKAIQPSRDLWGAIDARLEQQKILAGEFQKDLPTRRDGSRDKEEPIEFIARPHRKLVWTKRAFAIAAAVVIGFGAFWLAIQPSKPAWQVARLEGAPQIGKERVINGGQLRVGETLETDAVSRAKVDVGVIGNVEVEPNSRLRLLEAKTTDHRLALDRGTIHATIWAPPRLFFVETPSATAVDLGCAYTLAVDDHGASILQVTSGWVALEYGGRESIVPAGAMCVTRPGFGPGTPFLEDASEQLRAALEKFDFESGGIEALATVLSEARNMDSITLWHLLFRVSFGDRARVYDRLAVLVPAPEGVTRQGVLQGDNKMLEAWQKHLNLGVKKWWQFWQ